MPRLATYLIPEPETRLYQMASAILGYDVFAERDLPLPGPLEPYAATIRDWIGAAHDFGFHATIGDALEYPDLAVDAIEDNLEAIAAATPPFTLTNGRIHDRFRHFPGVLVGTFDCATDALKNLEDRVVTEINVRHTGSPHFAKRVATYTELQLAQFERFGSPNVRSLFDLHFSLATSVPDAETWRLLSRLFVDELGLFATPDQRTIAVDKIHLLEQRADGHFRIRRSFPLVNPAADRA